MLNSFNIFVALLQIVCSIGAAVCSYLLLNWVQVRLLLQLDARLSEVEGRVNREIKIRASDASRQSKNWEKELIQRAAEETKPQESSLDLWRRQKFGKA